MSLAKMLLEGTASNLTASEASRYSADEGAAILAMESAELLQDIFMESECKENEIVLNAALEGYAPDSEIVQEGVGAALKGALDKVIAWFKKMKDGVVAFFKNVVKYLDKVFLSGKDFVSKYKNELLKRELDGFTYTMYKYDNDAIDEAGSDKLITEAEANAEEDVNEIEDQANKLLSYGDTLNIHLNSDKTTDEEKKRKTAEMERGYNTLKDEYRKKKIELLEKTDVEDIDTEKPTTSGVSASFLKAFRGGAESESDKEELDVDIRDSIKIVENSSKYITNVNKLSNKVKTKFDKGIRAVEKLQRTLDKMPNSSNVSYVSKSIGLCTDMIGFYQNYENEMVTAWKTVLSERYKVHTSIVKKALTYKPKKD